MDTGSDLNLIKLSVLNPQVLVDESNCYRLTGINEQVTQTLGKVELTLQVNNSYIETEFHVVHPNFNISHEGIPGKPFLRKNKLIIDFKTNQVIFADTHEQIISPRTEAILTINVNQFPDTNNLLIHNQTITENLICGNVITQTENGKIKIPVSNISEKDIHIKNLTIEELAYEEYREEKTYIVSSEQSQRKANANRISLLRNSIQTDHLNTEEKESIQDICDLYSDIFYLEGDRLTSTDAVYHEINTPAAVEPINERPYRLPFRHKLEIDKQIKELEENQIITPSKSPWNAPLLVVPKKPDKNGEVKFRVCVDFRKLNNISKATRILSLISQTF